MLLVLCHSDMHRVDTVFVGSVSLWFQIVFLYSVAFDYHSKSVVGKACVVPIL